MNHCDNCLRITNVNEISIVIPTIFQIDIVFEGKLCKQCKSFVDWVIYQYLDIFEEQSRKLGERKIRLDFTTRNGLK